MKKTFQVVPVGVVLKQGDKKTLIRIYDPYTDALLGLEQFSHIIVLYWFDQNDHPEKRSVLRVHPRGDKKNPLTGVFATRSPARPNLIAVAPVKIKRIEKTDIIIDEIDALHNSPVIDIKPYFPLRDPKAIIRTPEWAK